MIKVFAYEQKAELRTPPYTVVLLKIKNGGGGGELLNNLLLKAKCVMGIL